MNDAERILVTVRTYPTPSTRYQETVCVGGIAETGQWRRLYPVPLRYLQNEQQFKTWDVIRAVVRPAKRDNRPESRRAHLPTLQIVDHLNTWSARSQWVLPTLQPSLKAVVGAGLSLAPVSVGVVKELVAKPTADNWDSRRAEMLENRMLFDKPRRLEKIPYEFRFIWQDGDGDEYDSLVISWELAETWRRYRNRYDDPIEKIREKLLGDMFSSMKQVSFFMGNHSRFRKTFMVCGWFFPPRSEVDSGSLFP